MLVFAFVASAVTVNDYAPYPRPDAGYVTDAANVLSPAEEERIEHWLRAVETKSGTEIIVVTIPSINDYPNTENTSINAFATALFNRWRIGNVARNDGVLFLIAVNDRKARIELGAGYPASRDADATAIMQNVIVPRFRKNDYAGGITEGVKAIVNKFTTQRIGIRWGLFVIPLVAIALLFVGISLLRDGRRGWGWVIIGLALVLLLSFLYLLVMLSRRRDRSSTWAPGGAGGFGGGFSTGGGATGSW